MPVYPEITFRAGTFIMTVDPFVFIESMKGEGDEREIIYINFKDKRRWLVKGDCHACGLGDIGSVESKRMKISPGKRMGEAWSTFDPEYESRLDIPVTPSYDRHARHIARKIGIDPYPCGLSFERLLWSD